jgi:hypothetical protein
VFSAGQACSHIGALLFLLSDMVAKGYQHLPDDPTCTEQLCKWTAAKCKYMHALFIDYLSTGMIAYKTEENDDDDDDDLTLYKQTQSHTSCLSQNKKQRSL